MEHQLDHIEMYSNIWLKFEAIELESILVFFKGHFRELFVAVLDLKNSQNT